MTKDITLHTILIEEVAPALLEDIKDVSDLTWNAWEYDLGTNQRLQLVHNIDHHRGGVVFVGSGSSGLTLWLDAATPEEIVTAVIDIP